MTRHWTERLSEYQDGTLDPREAHDLEAHLATCAECSATLAALRTVTASAAALGAREPARDLWPAIAARLSPRAALDPATRAGTAAVAEGLARPGLAGGQPAGATPHDTAGRPARRPGPLARLTESLRSLGEWRLSFSLPQLAGAALALVVVSGGAAWMALRQPPSGAPAAPPVAALPAPPAGAAVVGFAQYDAAIAELERALAERRAELDSSTVRVVERNLAAIDRAIAEARRALDADPTDPWLHDHLASTMRRKMGLLRRATDAAAFPT